MILVVCAQTSDSGRCLPVHSTVLLASQPAIDPTAKDGHVALQRSMARHGNRLAPPAADEGQASARVGTAAVAMRLLQRFWNSLTLTPGSTRAQDDAQLQCGLHAAAFPRWYLKSLLSRRPTITTADAALRHQAVSGFVQTAFACCSETGSRVDAQRKTEPELSFDSQAVARGNGRQVARAED